MLPSRRDHKSGSALAILRRQFQLSGRSPKTWFMTLKGLGPEVLVEVDSERCLRLASDGPEGVRFSIFRRSDLNKRPYR
jgi:hypothetical protein